ncbi:globin domain-containing protein [uncultured Pelagimonas sp.]|uniref:globin domain-containing protein n=1 Tax=uncultured Pelagimonas sp. TaxID=1618102 RepID=UPI00261AA374|nr:globin domain-containing protein [uncultured Pelagimonas sp.]
MSEFTQEQIWHVTRSFNRLKAAHNDFADEFYFILFERAPAVRAFFPDHICDQSRKLEETLELVVQNLPNLAVILQPILEMAERHVGYGATPEHYEVVRVALFDTIVQMTPFGLSEPEVQAWDLALQSICDLMVGHAYSLAS